MFYHAHAYHSSLRSNGGFSPQRLLGALLPDSALTGTISWTDLHDNERSRRFFDSIAESDAASELVKGIEDHNELDRISHDKFHDHPGYAYYHQTQDLVELVTIGCSIETKEQARGIAHNFIESGVDINLLATHPDLYEEVQRNARDIDSKLAIKSLAEWLGEDPSIIKQKLESYLSIIKRFDLRIVDDWVELWGEITTMLLGKSIDRTAVRKALILSTELTADDYMEIF